jgi:DHA2 family multidrug resistance protein
MSDYPVETAGLVMAPRGLGNLVAIMIAGRLVSRIDPRYLVGTGLIMLCGSFYIMTGWTPDVSQDAIITTIVVQGFGLGLVFMPLQVLAFGTLAPVMWMEAASLFNLVRNVGAAIGVSVVSTVLARNTQALHEVIGGSATPFNRALAAVGAFNPNTHHGIAVLDQLVNQQAEIIAYMNDYVLLICTTLPAALLLLVMRKPRQRVKAEPVE